MDLFWRQFVDGSLLPLLYVTIVLVMWRTFKPIIKHYVYYPKVCRKLVRMAQELVRRVVDGDTHGTELTQGFILDGFAIGWSDMARVYQNYIRDLPLEKRHEIIDKLLQNQVVRCKGQYTDVATLLDMMNYMEIETIIYAIDEGARILQPDGSVAINISRVKYGSSELANDVIAFRLGNPC